jgi:hypothetical protein
LSKTLQNCRLSIIRDENALNIGVPDEVTDEVPDEVPNEVSFEVPFEVPLNCIPVTVLDSREPKFNYIQLNLL